MNNYLPTKKDFDPWGCLDGQHAWKQFGGLTLDEAYKKFCKKPDFYQEDFMFMGTKAFLYYIPVLKKYVQELDPKSEGDDCSLHILACGMESQLEQNFKATQIPIRSLTELVLSEIGNSNMNNEDKKRVIKKWKEIKKLTNGSS